jgi:hypothetical protein
VTAWSLVALSSVLFVLGCGGSGGSDLCSQLAQSYSCCPRSSEAGCPQMVMSNCKAAIAKANADKPACAPFVDALIKCGTSLEVSCSSATSVAITGDGKFFGGSNFVAIDSYDVVVADSKCDVFKRGLEACRTCPTAVGAAVVDALGVGDRCPASAPCAAGLSCQSGICTKSCSMDSDCEARADGCRLQFQHPNVCVAGRCTRSCADRFLCEVNVSSSSACVNRACTLP